MYPWRIVRISIVVALLGGLVLSGCDFFRDEEEPEVTIVELEIGDGDEARDGMWVTVWYTVWLPGDTTAVQSNVGDEAPYRFRLGYKEVIEGFDRGVKGMREGGRRRITIPPELGYGGTGINCDTQGNNCSIPPNSTLVFEVALVSAEPPAPSYQF